MDSLPPEMLAQIIGIVRTDGNLARYSTISRAWKASIERLTFQRITITTDELDEFAVLFEGDNISGGRESIALREIDTRYDNES
jgi:hypothetical protein